MPKYRGKYLGGVLQIGGVPRYLTWSSYILLLEYIKLRVYKAPRMFCPTQASCGTCGGGTCKNKCCTKAIEDTKKSCNSNLPPCIISDLNLGVTSFTVSGTNAITVMAGVDSATLSAAVTVTEGGAASAAVSFTLNTAAVGGTIKLTPTATGITFTPTSVDVADGQTGSATFTATAAAGTAAGAASINVALTGSAINIGSSTVTVTGTNALMVLGALSRIFVLGGGPWGQKDVVAYKGRSTYYQMTLRIDVPIPLPGGCIIFKLTSPGLIFDTRHHAHPDISMCYGQSKSTAFYVVADKDATVGTPDITVELSGKAGGEYPRNIGPTTMKLTASTMATEGMIRQIKIADTAQGSVGCCKVRVNLVRLE